MMVLIRSDKGAKDARVVTTGDSVTSRHDPRIMRATLAVALYLLYSYSLSMDMELWSIQGTLSHLNY